MMQIKFLKAGTGDSILLHIDGHNILVDGGNDITYLFPELRLIQERNEKLDLVVITHHDDDHIFGIIKLLEKLKMGELGGSNFIKMIFFNPLKKLGKRGKQLSYTQVVKVSNLVKELRIEHKESDKEYDSFNFSNLTIDAFSPDQELLRNYSEKGQKYLASRNLCDWTATFSSLDGHLSDKSKDNSIANRTSIVLFLKWEGKRTLLTGDVTPDRLKETLLKIMHLEGSDKVHLTHFKLPHHGSYKSLNKEILNLLYCENYIISANGRKSSLPNKRAILKIIKWANHTEKRISFFFNYAEIIDLLAISAYERKKYNLNLQSNNRDYGLLF